MEPNDSDLQELLREWKAPETPRSLESRVLDRRPSWWRVLLHGSIRVPVPVAFVLAMIIVGGAWRLSMAAPGGCSAASVAPALKQVLEKPALPATEKAACAAGSSC